jgi:Rrf2 family protein
MLSNRAKYALKALVSLAASGDQASVVAARLAEREQIPRQFLELILVELKHHGLLRSRRGRAGGYTLSRRPEDISVGQVVRLMDGPLALVSCASQTAYAPCAECADAEACGIRRVFKEVRDHTARVLDGISLAEMSRRQAGGELLS